MLTVLENNNRAIAGEVIYCYLILDLSKTWNFISKTWPSWNFLIVKIFIVLQSLKCHTLISFNQFLIKKVNIDFTKRLKVQINQQILQNLSVKNKKTIEVNHINNTIYKAECLLTCA